MSSQQKALLGAEHDEQLRQALMDALRRLGAKQISHDSAVGGSQELDMLEVDIAGQRVFIESETYVGLSISGEAWLVEQIRQMVTARMSQAADSE